MKKSTKIKLALLPSILIIPTIIGITLTSCEVVIGGTEENKPEITPPPTTPDPEKPNPPTEPEKPEPPVEPEVPPNPEDKNQINFKQKDIFDFGDANLMAYEVSNTWIKNTVIKNKTEIFEIPTSISPTFDWDSNIVIGLFYGNADLGEITFDLTLNNAGQQKQITKNIKFTGFKSANTSLKKEVQRINAISRLELLQNSLTSDELEIVDHESILYYLKNKFISNDFEYKAVNFKKDINSKLISFNIEVKYTKPDYNFLPPLQSKLFTINYELNTTPITYSLDIKFADKSQSENYGQEITLIADLNTHSTFFVFEWNIETTDGYEEHEQPPYSNKLLLSAFDPAEYNVSVNVKTKSGKQIATATLNLNLVNEHYKIRFDNPEEPIIINGVVNDLPSVYVNNKEFLKQQVIKNRNKIFTRDDLFDSNTIDDIQNPNISKNLIDNIQINKVIPDDQIGKLTINLTLNNATSDAGNITSDIILFGFNKQLTDEQLIINYLNTVKLKPNKDIGHMTAAEGVAHKNTLFDLDEIKAKQNGVLVSLIAKLDTQNEDSIILELTGSLLTNINIDKTITKHQSGFMVIKNLGELDRIQNKILKTPAGTYSYKNAEIIRQINMNYLDTGDWFSKANRFGWDQYEKEVVYQSRFALYQSFHDNFTEINYYSKSNNKNIHVIAEGVVKNDFNGQYIVQTTQEMWPRSINLKSGDILRVEYIVPRTNEKSFYPTTVTTTLSFSPDSMDLNKEPGWWKVFGMQLPGYQLNIQTVNQQGNVLKNWWNYSNNKMRSFVFSIGGSQGRKN